MTENHGSYPKEIFCPIIKDECKYAGRIPDYWYCKVGDYGMPVNDAPCKKGTGKTTGAQNFTFILYEDGSATLSKSYKPKDIITLSRNQVLDIYDDLTRLYGSSPTKVKKDGKDV